MRLVCLLPLVFLGCARPDSVADRHIVEMRETMGRVEADQDGVSRSFATEEGDIKAIEPAQKGGQVTAPPKAKPQPPRAVQIDGEADSHESDDPNDPAQRPEIKVHGVGGGPVSPSSSPPPRRKKNNGNGGGESR